MQTVELQSRPLAVLTFAPSSIAPGPVNPRPRNKPPAPAPPSPSVAPGLNSLQEHFVFSISRIQVSRYLAFSFQNSPSMATGGLVRSHRKRGCFSEAPPTARSPCKADCLRRGKLAASGVGLPPEDGTVVVSKRQLSNLKKQFPNGTNSCTSNPAGSVRKC